MNRYPRRGTVSMKDGAAGSSPSARRISRMMTLRTPSVTWVFGHPARSSSSLETSCPRSSTSRRRTANAFGVRAATPSRCQSRSAVRSSQKSPNARRRPASIVAPLETGIPAPARLQSQVRSLIATHLRVSGSDPQAPFKHAPAAGAENDYELTHLGPPEECGGRLALLAVLERRRHHELKRAAGSRGHREGSCQAAARGQRGLREA